MSDEKERENTVMQLAVARCLADEMKYDEIIERLSTEKRQLHPSTITKLRKDNPHFKKIERTLFTPRLPESCRELYMELMDEKLGLKHVRKTLTRWSPYSAEFKLDVIHGSEMDSDKAPGFSKSVGEIVAKLIDRSSTVGVAWGDAVSPPESMNYSFTHRIKNKGEHPVKFIPLCGVGNSSIATIENTSTNAAITLHKIVNVGFSQDEFDLFNLNCIPLAHPSQIEEVKDSTKLPTSTEMTTYFQTVFPDYLRIFGSSASGDKQSTLVNQVDMILTGLGTRDGLTMQYLFPDSFNSVPVDWKSSKTMAHQRLLSEVIEGDIAGIALPKQDSNLERNCRICDSQNRRLYTLKPKHLIQCAENSNQSLSDFSPPGVVVIASGKEKLNQLISAVQQGYVSRAIVDFELANAIESLSSKERTG